MSMKAYVITLIGVVLICGLAEMFSPDGEGGGIKKHVGLLGGLCVLCIAIQPIGSLIGRISGEGSGIFSVFAQRGEDVVNYEEIFEENLMRNGALNAGTELHGAISEKFGIDYDSFDVSVTFADGGDKYVVRSVAVILYPQAVLADPHLIEEYVSGLLGCTCEIIYGYSQS